MAKKTEKKQRKSSIEIKFANDLSPALYTQFIEGVISANLQEKVPAHLQEQLIDKFVEAGLMAP